MPKRSTTCELREKDVINLCDGARLGHACDFEFDTCDGRICALIVCRETGFMGFGGEECFAVLVKMQPDELCACEKERKKDKRRR